MEQYELVIEQLTETGRIQRDVYNFEARSETEASVIVKQYRTQYNLVNVFRINN